MKQDVSKMVGICGLYCGTCPCYLADKKHDEKYLERMSRERGYSVEEIHCHGCLSDKVAVHCKDCSHGFRKCASEKQVTWCFQCDDFPCQRLKDFKDVLRVRRPSVDQSLIVNYLKWSEQYQAA